MDDQEAVYVADRTVELVRVLDALGCRHAGVGRSLPCPVHKEGTEIKASAKLYADNALYCWACLRQYGPVTVWASRQGLSEATAAQQLLARWPPPAAAVAQLLRTRSLPPTVAVPVAYRTYLEGVLREFRGRVPLPAYRGWTRRVDEYVRELGGVPEADRDRQVGFLRGQIQAEARALLDAEG
jgi:hypothetical protein